MDVFLFITAVVCALIGIAGCIVPVLPGVALTYAGLLLASFGSWSSLQASTLWIWLAVTIVVSLLDYVLPGYLTRLFGGSRAGSLGATLGVFAGMFLGGFAGIIVGPFLGAVVGEMMHDSRSLGRALLSGIGSFVAFIAGTGLKLVVSVWMFLLIWDDLWPVVRGWFSSWF